MTTINTTQLEQAITEYAEYKAARIIAETVAWNRPEDEEASKRHIEAFEAERQAYEKACTLLSEALGASGFPMTVSEIRAFVRERETWFRRLMKHIK